MKIKRTTWELFAVSLCIIHLIHTRGFVCECVLAKNFSVFFSSSCPLTHSPVHTNAQHLIQHKVFDFFILLLALSLSHSLTLSFSLFTHPCVRSSGNEWMSPLLLLLLLLVGNGLEIDSFIWCKRSQHSVMIAKLTSTILLLSRYNSLYAWCHILFSALSENCQIIPFDFFSHIQVTYWKATYKMFFFVNFWCVANNVRLKKSLSIALEWLDPSLKLPQICATLSAFPF